MNKIVQNTLYLYGRQVVTTILALFTSRIVLQALGVVDLGVYGVVGSVVTMFAFVSGAVSSATGRFLTFGLGKGDINKLRDTFACSLLMHIIIAIAVFFLLETAGVWFLNNKMNIPPERMMAANYVLQCVLISTMIGVVAMPFGAVFGAHEQMGFTSMMSLLNVLLKLGAIIIVYHSDTDRLTLYATLLLVLSIIETIITTLVSRKRFKEVTFRPRYIKDVVSDMSRYAGWSLTGSVGVMGRNSGVNIVVNMLCGVAVNASRGLACQISAQMMGLAANLQTAFSPQITKRYAAHDEEGMLRLTIRCSKYSFFLICLLSIPLFLRMHAVLQLWLGQVPPYLMEFAILIMVMEMIYWVATPIGVAIGATGNNKWYQVSMAIIMLLDVPVSYLLLRTGVDPYYAVFGSIVIAMVAFMAGMLLLKREIELLSLSEWLLQIVRCVVAATIAFFICYLVHCVLADNLLGFLAVCGCSLLFTTSLFYLLALDSDERSVLTKVLRTKRG